MDKLESIIKRIISEEFWPEPSVRAARRLHNIGIFEIDVLKIDMVSPVKIQVCNALRDIENENTVDCDSIQSV